MKFPGNNKLIINQLTMREMVAYYLMNEVFEDPEDCPVVGEISYLTSPDLDKGSFSIKLLQATDSKHGPSS